MRPYICASEDARSKRKILSVALDLFVKKGVDRVSIRAIADRAGYSNPLIFRFFKDKEELIQRLFDACYSHVYSGFEGSYDAEASFEANLRSMVLTFLKFAEDDLEALLFAQENLRQLWLRSEPRRQNQSFIELMRRLLLQGIREGEVRPGAELSLLISGYLGFLSQLGRMAYFEEIHLDDRMAEAVERCLMGMGR